MRYHNITKCDMLNGDGLRVVLWVSGCAHRCKGCHNHITWNYKDGLKFDTDALTEIYRELQQDWCAGLTISGGDPLYNKNVDEILLMVKYLKGKFPDKSIWIYTGHEWEFIVKSRNSWGKTVRDILTYTDVLVDGAFKKELLSPEKKWVGSSNQRVIDVQQSLKLKKGVVLWESEQWWKEENTEPCLRSACDV